MKKLLDVMVLVSVAILLLIILVQSADGQVRRDRTLANPQMIIPKAKMTKNNMGGYNYHIKGKLVGKSTKNKMGSYDVYVMGRMKYKGVKFGETTKYQPMHAPHAGSVSDRSASSMSSRTNSGTISKSSRSKSRNSNLSERQQYLARKKQASESRDAYLKQWSASRASSSSGRVYWWEHYYPSVWK